MKVLFLVLIISFLLNSCQQKEQSPEISLDTSEKGMGEARVFEDNLEMGLKEFWKKELVDDNRIIVEQDPLNKNNKTLKVDHFQGDFKNGGYRSELVLTPKDSFGYINNYSFKFMLPQSFFKKEDKGWIMIHQWHDQVPTGYTWKTNKNKTRPPISLIINNVDGDYFISFLNGLNTGARRETNVLKWEEKLKPNTWYEFSCEVFWSLYNGEGYARPKINNQFIGEKNNPKKHIKNYKVFRANMYNVLPNYFKFGIYRDKEQKGDKTIYFDNFKMVSKRVAHPIYDSEN